MTMTSTSMLFDPRQRQVFRRIFAGPPVNRLELARLLGLTPNVAGSIAASMIDSGLLRECAPAVKGRGRPRIPLEVDTARRRILGVALYSGAVELAHVNLRGQLLSPAQPIPVNEPGKLVKAAARAIAKQLTPDHLAIGLSVTGFLDPDQKRILLSSAIAGQRDGDLTPIVESAGQTPLLMQNDMHALAARWLLTQPHAPAHTEDILLILLSDSQVGATILIGGKPNAGCVLGGNELGHMRFPIVTDRCFCGHTGCLERIFSSEYARARLGLVGTLPHMIERYDGKRGPMADLIGLLATGISNVANFLRPHRVVLVSPYTRHPVFTNELLKQTRGRLLEALSERVRIDLWEQPASTPAETAAYLPLAALNLEGWT
jgi:predicted NBD/HSP70 family sugar kinase